MVGKPLLNNAKYLKYTGSNPGVPSSNVETILEDYIDFIQANSTLISANATGISNLSTSLAATDAAIAQETTDRANADAAIQTQLNTVEATANSASQPGDNISDFVNDENYIKLSDIPDDILTSIEIQGTTVIYTDEDGTETSLDLGAIFPPESARIVSSTLTGTILRLTRNDSSQLTVDLAPIIPVLVASATGIDPITGVTGSNVQQALESLKSLIDSVSVSNSHGDLTNLGVDDHPQYLNNTRHNLITGNPHNVTKADVGLDLVDNTRDVDKAVSLPQQTALDLKANVSDVYTQTQINSFNSTINAAIATKISGADVPTHETTTSLVYNPGTTTLTFEDEDGDVFAYDLSGLTSTAGDPVVSAVFNNSTKIVTVTKQSGATITVDLSTLTLTKAQVGLGNVDNTSDIDKPISAAQQTALNLKANQTDLTQEITDRSNADTNLQNQIDSNDTDITNLQTEQTTQNTNISNVTSTANTALQPGDNVSELANDSNFQTEAQVDSKIADVIDSAPGALDTLNELAEALGDDANYAATIANQQAIQDTAIGLNTAKVSADGSVTSHSDVTDAGSGAIITTVERNVITNFATNVLSTVLAGLSTTTNAAITATDTVLGALGKLQAQINNIASNAVQNHSELTLDDGTNPHGTTKADVGLGNVDNTSDLDKSISTATQAALDLKYDASNPSNYVDAAGASTAAPVQDVNGQTGNVVLDTSLAPNVNDTNTVNVNSTTDIIVKGGNFDPSTTFTISGGSGTVTINSTNVTEHNSATLNITTDSTVDTYNVTAANGSLTSFGSASLVVEPTVFTPGDNVNWENVTPGLTTGSGTLVGNGSGSWGTQATFGSIPANTDGSVYWTFSNFPTNMMLGLNSDPATDASYTSIDFAIYVQNSSISGTLFQNGNGQAAGSTVIMSAGEEFEMRRTGSTIALYRANTLLKTFSNTSTAELHFDCSIFSGTVSLTNVRIELA